MLDCLCFSQGCLSRKTRNDESSHTYVRTGNPVDPASGTTPLIGTPHRKRPRYRSTSYHVFVLLGGLVALSLSGFLLSGSSVAFAEALGVSDTIVGLTLLSFVTTLPEKLVAVLAARRGHAGILVANTVGSNVFLLTLVLGITLLAGGIEVDSKTRWYDVSVVLLSAIVFAGTIWTRKLKKWIGAVMMGGYLGYIVGNFFVGDVFR